MALAGIAFGVVNVLAPLRLAKLGASGTVIAATFLCGALVESAMSPVAGRLSDRFGASRPLMVSLAVCAVVSVLLPVTAALPLLIGVLVAGTPFYGSLFAPASAMVSAGARGLRLNQGIAFALSNLTWAAGQSVAAAGSGALAQATSDLVPYALLALACLGSLAVLYRVSHAGSNERVHAVRVQPTAIVGVGTFRSIRQLAVAMDADLRRFGCRRCRPAPSSPPTAPSTSAAAQ